jgi:hypothetical protein
VAHPEIDSVIHFTALKVSHPSYGKFSQTSIVA